MALTPAERLEEGIQFATLPVAANEPRGSSQRRRMRQPRLHNRMLDRVKHRWLDGHSVMKAAPFDQMAGELKA